jgi:hypothetical protein
MSSGCVIGEGGQWIDYPPPKLPTRAELPSASKIQETKDHAADLARELRKTEKALLFARNDLATKRKHADVVARIGPGLRYERPETPTWDERLALLM